MNKHKSLITKYIILSLSVTAVLLATGGPANAATGAEWGINIDPANLAGHPSDASLQGTKWVRIEFKDCSDVNPISDASIDKYRPVLQEYKDAHIKVLLIWDYLSYPNAERNVSEFADRAAEVERRLGNLIDAYEIWNEEDLAATYPLDTATYANILSAVSSAIKGVTADKTVIMGGLASGQPSYVTSVKNALGGSFAGIIDGIGVHPYAQMIHGYPPGGVGEITELLDNYAAVADGLPLWMTEMGLDTTDQTQQAEYIRRLNNELQNVNNHTVEKVMWFAWSDGMVNPFGIVHDYSTPKEAHKAYFVDVLGVNPPPTPAESGVTHVVPEGGTSCGGGPENPGLSIREGYIHPGIDIRPQRGVASSSYVYSTHAGFVTYAGPAPISVRERGWMVQIESDLNRDNVPDVITRYTHLVPNSLRINDVWYRRFAFTPEYFASLINGMDGIEKLPFGYGPYVARNQLIGMVGDSGSPGHVHIQYEILTNRFRSLYGLGLDTDVPYACVDSPYVNACSIDAGRPGFFFPKEKRRPSRVRGPLYTNAGFVTPPPALTPIVITPTPAPPTPTPASTQPTPTPGGTCDINVSMSCYCGGMTMSADSSGGIVGDLSIDIKKESSPGHWVGINCAAAPAWWHGEPYSIGCGMSGGTFRCHSTLSYNGNVCGGNQEQTITCP